MSNDICIEIEKGAAGLYYATSPDLPGLLVCAPTMEELERKVPQAIAELKALMPPEPADDRA